jgi:hypothetical protein
MPVAVERSLALAQVSLSFAPLSTCYRAQLSTVCGIEVTYRCDEERVQYRYDYMTNEWMDWFQWWQGAGGNRRTFASLWWVCLDHRACLSSIDVYFELSVDDIVLRFVDWCCVYHIMCQSVWLCRLFGFAECIESSRFARSITRQLGRVVKALAC